MIKLLYIKKKIKFLLFNFIKKDIKFILFYKQFYIKMFLNKK